MKECRFCKKEKSLDEFHKHPLTKDKRQSFCKPCALFHRNSIGKHNQLKKRYGISLEQYNEMFVKQEGKCAICKQHQMNFKVSLAVDHCHTTGKVRGLLCASCNRALGYFRDSTENLKIALSYLECAEQSSNILMMVSPLGTKTL